MVEHRTPNPGVGGSTPSWPAISIIGLNQVKLGVEKEEKKGPEEE